MGKTSAKQITPTPYRGEGVFLRGATLIIHRKKRKSMDFSLRYRPSILKYDTLGSDNGALSVGP
jgi:hypothetical protein